MKTENDGVKQADKVERAIITERQAMELVDRAMDESRDEPENFIRMLLLLHDSCSDSMTQDNLFFLMR